MERPTAGGKQRTPIWLVSAAFLICLISSLIALNQDPHLNAFRPDTPFPQNLINQDWWRYPQETNAFKRLPVIDFDLNDIHVSKDGQKIWVVGNPGMILHSRDSGKTWKPQT